MCSRIRWWHSLRSFTTGYRDNTPVGVSLSPLAICRYAPSQTHSMHPASQLPRSGYHPLSACTHMHRVRHTACTRHSSYPDRGYTSVTAGKRCRQASVTRGWMTPPSHYPEAGSTSTHMCIISESVQPVCNPGRGRYIYIYHAGGGTRFARLPPVIEIIPRSGYRSHLSPCTDMHRVRHTACTRRRSYPGRGIALTSRYMPICTESDTQHAPDGVATPIGVTPPLAICRYTPSQTHRMHPA